MNNHFNKNKMNNDFNKNKMNNDFNMMIKLKLKKTRRSCTFLRVKAVSLVITYTVTF